MFGRKVFFLAAGYVAGNLVNTLYNSQKKRAMNLQKKEDMKLMVESFITTQKNFFSDMEKRYIPKEHSSKYEEKKQEFLDLAKKYTKKGKELLKEVQDDERYQEGKDVVEKNLLKAKLHGENTIKKGKLIASDAKKKVKKMKK